MVLKSFSLIMAGIQKRNLLHITAAGTYYLGAYESSAKGVRAIGFYPNARTLEDALPVNLPNKDINGIDWTVFAPSLTTLKGKLVVTEADLFRVANMQSGSGTAGMMQYGRNVTPSLPDRTANLSFADCTPENSRLTFLSVLRIHSI